MGMGMDILNAISKPFLDGVRGDPWQYKSIYAPMFRECKLSSGESERRGQHMGNELPLTPCSCMAASFSSVKPNA